MSGPFRRAAPRRDRCIYDRWTAIHGDEVEECEQGRVFDTPYCLEHLHRVAWLSLGDERPAVVVEHVAVVPWWIKVGFAIMLWWWVCTC